MREIIHKPELEAAFGFWGKVFSPLQFCQQGWSLKPSGALRSHKYRQKWNGSLCSSVNPHWAIKIRNRYKFHQMGNAYTTSVSLDKLQNYIIYRNDSKISRVPSIRTNLNISLQCSV